MKRNILILFCLLLLNIGLFAQVSIGIEPAVNEETFFLDLNDPEAEGIIYTTIVNTSNETVDVRWNRIENNLPESWQSLICDNSGCYDSWVHSNVISDTLNAPITLAPGESGTLNVYIRPRHVEGTGGVTIELYNTAHPDELISTGTFTFHIEASPTSIDEIEKASLQVYPNPSPDYFQLTNSNIVDRIVVYNIIGRAVKNFDVYTGERYEVSDLPNGMYLISLISEEEGVIKTVRLSKRAYRP